MVSNQITAIRRERNPYPDHGIERDDAGVRHWTGLPESLVGMLAASVDLPVDDGRAEDDRLKDAVANISTFFATFGTVSDADRNNLAHILKVVFRNIPAPQVDAAASAL